MNGTGRQGGGRFLQVLLLVALGGLLLVLALEFRTNRKRVGELEDRISARSKDLAELTASQQELQRKGAQSSLKARDAEKEVEDLSSRTRELARDLEALKADLARVRKERDEHLTARLDLGGRLDAAEQTLATTGSRLEETRTEVARLGSDLEKALERAVDLREEVARRTAERDQAIDAKEEMARRLREVLAKLRSEPAGGE